MKRTTTNGVIALGALKAAEELNRWFSRWKITQSTEFDIQGEKITHFPLQKMVLKLKFFLFFWVSAASAGRIKYEDCGEPTKT
jgi:hypothetical protein